MATSHLVIDSGTGCIKAGFAGDEYPQCTFSNILGSAKYSKCMTGAVEGFHVGDSVQKHRGMLKLSYPMRHGMIEDWEGMEKIWAHVYSTMNVMSEEHNVLLTETPFTPQRMKERVAEVFFETFNVLGMCYALQPVLALYASGNNTGVVLSSGDGVTHAVPIYEGYSIPHAMARINLAGRDVTEHLQLQLRKSGHHFTTGAEFEILRQMKEHVCRVALLPQMEIQVEDKGGLNYKEHKLPDGNVIKVGAEQFLAPEVLFNPSMIGSECTPIHEVISTTIAKSDTDIRAHLYTSIHLAGGTTLLKGFGDRLLAEMRKTCPPKAPIKIRAPPERKYTAWLGGSILASLAAFKNACVTRQKYLEHGVKALSTV
uniref:Actin n=1 Tax=Eutreptiella gymnastica TaxID=73025 RepID=A0A7S1JFH4_9EUGL|mmetsp:Transcript_91236/g.158181  ORF Transcript_91236/g.158181 Transcript_91236/m.158181 type:complete len:370 (+) Transcript_91236:67-1176(+)